MSEVNNGTAEAAATEAVESDSTTTQPAVVVAEQPAEKRKYKYKVDGAEIEEELTEEDVKRHLSMSKAAYKRMSEAATTKKQSEQLIKMLRENPEEVLNNEQIMGSKKFREIAEAYLSKQLEEEMLTPEQKYQKQMQSELKKYQD